MPIRVLDLDPLVPALAEVPAGMNAVDNRAQGEEGKLFAGKATEDRLQALGPSLPGQMPGQRDNPPLQGLSGRTLRAERPLLELLPGAGLGIQDIQRGPSISVHFVRGKGAKPKSPKAGVGR